MKADKITSTEESLAIITEMIRQTKRNVRGGSFYFILWGWVSFIGFAGHFLLEQMTDFAYPFAIWAIAIPAWIVSLLYGRKKSEEQRITTYGDKLILWTWVAFTICIVIVIFSGLFFRHLNGLIILMAGMSTFMTGLIIRYKPLIIGGSALWIFAAIALGVPYEYSYPVAAVGILCGYLIPGYMLKNAE